MPVVFLMDRFGYARTVDEAVYERNKEAADSESRVVIHCMNTGRISVFTDTGKQPSSESGGRSLREIPGQGNAHRQPVQL